MPLPVFVDVGDAPLEQVAQRQPQFVELGQGLAAERVVAARQVRFGDRDAQLAGFVEVGHRQFVQVAHQQPFAGLGARDHPYFAQLRQEFLHQRIGEQRFLQQDVVGVQAATGLPDLARIGKILR